MVIVIPMYHEKHEAYVMYKIDKKVKFDTYHADSDDQSTSQIRT